MKQEQRLFPETVSVEIPEGTPPMKAAMYGRMSTEHQQYSTENQRDVIEEYAKERNFKITASYLDEGKSGLRLKGRRGLKQLIEDVQSGKADFDTILVYDVSRWGRFQTGISGLGICRVRG